MDASDRKALAAVPLVVSFGGLLALAGSQQGEAAFGVPLFALSVGLAFLLQWLAFLPAYLLRTEKFYDLTGGITYISVVTAAVTLSSAADPRSLLLASLVVLWAVRLGGFLFTRIRRAGRDDRFDGIRESFSRFLLAWTLQGLWVAFTASAALAAITATERSALDGFALGGLLVWIFGFSFEIVADTQKRRFRENPDNRTRFIQTGLWSRCRHPNYFGEIVLWVGVAIVAAPVLRGWQWVTLVSPVFVAWLLTRVSGIPLLERKADETWGGDSDYEAYKKRTPVLIPRL
jgi:steroid 5-alpha reductase family enzyme